MDYIWHFIQMHSQSIVAISTLLTFLVLSLSLGVAWCHLRALRKENRITRIVELAEKYDSSEFQESLKQVYDLASIEGNLVIPNVNGIREPKNRNIFNRTFNYFEKLAILYKNNVVDNQVTYKLMGNIIVQYWDDLAQCIGVLRREEMNPLIFKEWENLAKEFMKRRKRDSERVANDKTKR